MTIAIDASRAVNESAGIGRYTLELVRNILALGTSHKFILIFTYWRADEKKEKVIKTFRGDNVEIRQTKIPGSLKETLWRGKSRLYNQLYRGADVVLAPSFLEFKRGLSLPQITVIHDMTTFLFPEQRGEEISKRLSDQTLLALKESAKVIAISKSTRKDITKLTPTSSDKTAVIYPGLTLFPAMSSELSKTYNLKPKNYILFVGTIEPRKNLKNLVAAFELLPEKLQSKYPLVVAGQKGWNALGVEKDKRIQYLGRVSDEKLAKLYSAAAVFVYPSLYEGFGLPVLEAMAAGTPVVTSNRSSLPEAAGIAAVLINPDNPKSIAEGLESVLMGKISRAQMVKAGREQAKKFSWEKSATEILKVLENIK